MALASFLANRLGRSLWSALKLALALWAIGFAALLLVVLLAPREVPEAGPADAIVCLGGGMSFGGWTLPAPDSQRRAETCAALYLAGAAPRILFTGAGHHVSSVAAAMARSAQDLGVPQSAILLEEEARSTIQNAVFSADHLPPETANILLVTDAYHLPRSHVLFRLFTPYEIDPVAAPIESLTADLAPGFQTTRRKHPTYLQAVLRESQAIWFNLGRLGFYGAGRAIGVEKNALIDRFN